MIPDAKGKDVCAVGPLETIESGSRFVEIELGVVELVFPKQSPVPTHEVPQPNLCVQSNGEVGL